MQSLATFSFLQTICMHEKKVLMTKYTPNFEQEPWLYHGLEILGAEYDWK